MFAYNSQGYHSPMLVKQWPHKFSVLKWHSSCHEISWDLFAYFKLCYLIHDDDRKYVITRETICRKHIWLFDQQRVCWWPSTTVICQDFSWSDDDQIRAYNDVMIGVMAPQITGVPIICLNICSGADQRKHQSSSPLAFVIGGFPWKRASNVENLMTSSRVPLIYQIDTW